MPQVILKYYPYIRTARKFFAPFSFFPPYLPKKHRKSKFCVGETRFSVCVWGGGNWDLVGGIQKILVGRGDSPLILLTRENPGNKIFSLFDQLWCYIVEKKRMGWIKKPKMISVISCHQSRFKPPTSLTWKVHPVGQQPYQTRTIHTDGV